MTMITTTTDPPSRRTSKRARKIIDLPVPPSVNRLWRYTAGRAYRSPAYQGWISDAGWELQTQRHEPIDAPAIRMVLRAGKPDKPRDLDNVLKALADLLEAHGLVKNDKTIVRIEAQWDYTVPAGRVHVELSRTTAP